MAEAESWSFVIINHSRNERVGGGRASPVGLGVRVSDCGVVLLVGARCCRGVERAVGGVERETPRRRSIQQPGTRGGRQAGARDVEPQRWTTTAIDRITTANRFHADDNVDQHSLGRWMGEGRRRAVKMAGAERSSVTRREAEKRRQDSDNRPPTEDAGAPRQSTTNDDVGRMPVPTINSVPSTQTDRLSPQQQPSRRVW